MSDTRPDVSSRTRISPLWIIPIVAVIAGIWMLAHSYLTEGPTFTIDFDTAEGLVAEKTKVRVLNVEVGMVKHIALKEGMSGVRVTLKLDLEAKPLLREDTQFWVVRARVGAGGVSGLGTLLSGAYIDLAPGTGAKGRREFTGLELPPLTAIGTPGLRIALVSDRSASIGAGDPILYRGLKAGRIETVEFDTERGEIRYSAFIDDPYDQIVDTSTRFWDTSGISFDASAAGIELNVGSLDTVLTGGAAFGSLEELPSGLPVTDGAEFKLYQTYADILDNPFQHGSHYVVAVDRSVGGLLPGAPVRFRGIQIGRVERILLKELITGAVDAGTLGKAAPIPVLIYVEPGRMEAPDTVEGVQLMRQGLETAVASGLRASLQSGNLLTGQKLVSLDFYPGATPAEMGRFQEYETIPTVGTGLAIIEQEIGTLLAKLNALPLGDTVDGANKALGGVDVALGSLDEMLKTADGLLKGDDVQALPAELAGTLDELRNVLDGFSEDSSLYHDLDALMIKLQRVLENLDRLTRKLGDKPNSLLLAPPVEQDPIPESRQ